MALRLALCVWLALGAALAVAVKLRMDLSACVGVSMTSWLRYWIRPDENGVCSPDDMLMTLLNVWYAVVPLTLVVSAGLSVLVKDCSHLAHDQLFFRIGMVGAGTAGIVTFATPVIISAYLMSASHSESGLEMETSEFMVALGGVLSSVFNLWFGLIAGLTAMFIYGWWTVPVGFGLGAAFYAVWASLRVARGQCGE